MGAMSEGLDVRAGDVYGRRLAENRAALIREQSWDRRYGYAKLTMLAVLFFGAIALIRTPVRLLWLLIPVAVFVGLGILHDRVLRQVLDKSRVLKFYERGLARLNDAWAGTGETGDRFLDPAHPYARDLDIFGKGSLFELLCTARTRAGEETLARWLLEAAPLDVIRARQSAMADLRERVDFRERLFGAGGQRAGGRASGRAGGVGRDGTRTGAVMAAAGDGAAGHGVVGWRPLLDGERVLVWAGSGDGAELLHRQAAGRGAG